MEVSSDAYAILQHLQGAEIELEKLALQLGKDQSSILAVLQELIETHMVLVKTFTDKLCTLTEEGSEYIVSGLPEKQVIQFLAENEGESEIARLKEALSNRGTIGISWAVKKRWVSFKADVIQLTPDGQNALSDSTSEETLLNRLKDNGPTRLSDLEGKWKKVLETLEKRKLVETRLTSTTTLSFSDQFSDINQFEIVDEVSIVTPKMLADGSWRSFKFKQYNIHTLSKDTPTGKIHPLMKILQETRKVFLEMGFKEIISPYVESSFWDFDALFQPQDHAAREMQDTFYISIPEDAELPQEFVSKVKATHENGGATGSLGWRYEWKEEIARKMILRTHTTATTVRYTAYHPKEISKVFIVGRVFRREAVDYKHLPEFHQIDGIVIDPNNSLASLFAILYDFYHKMGFEQVRVRPAFFPYTEPSVEVFVYFESRDRWIELGGAGVFRPEVTEPFGCPYPVLAWGLGLERLAMMRYDIEDIRQLYWSDLTWLEGVPLCR
ncbi:MAG: phenylalanine--tRNA ligase subunit alpha [Theionarchaea archaeon]|nr:phenylalanine--tRNA ligase subunit alpha [Theionarchaea archaeon]